MTWSRYTLVGCEAVSVIAERHEKALQRHKTGTVVRNQLYTHLHNLVWVWLVHKYNFVHDVPVQALAIKVTMCKAKQSAD